MRVHRLRLVVSGVRSLLKDLDDASLTSLAPAIASTATDVGSLGADLARWLRARGLTGAGRFARAMSTDSFTSPTAGKHAGESSKRARSLGNHPRRAFLAPFGSIVRLPD